MPLNKRGSVSARFSVWFSRFTRRRLLEPATGTVEAAGVHRRKRRLARDDMERGAALGARFGEHEACRPKARKQQA